MNNEDLTKNINPLIHSVQHPSIRQKFNTKTHSDSLRINITSLPHMQHFLLPCMHPLLHFLYINNNHWPTHNDLMLFKGNCYKIGATAAIIITELQKLPIIASTQQIQVKSCHLWPPPCGMDIFRGKQANVLVQIFPLVKFNQSRSFVTYISSAWLYSEQEDDEECQHSLLHYLQPL